MQNSPAFKLLLLVMMMCGTVFAQDTRTSAAGVTHEMLFADDPQLWSKPTVVLPPGFPQGELRNNIRASVDVAIDLDARGKVKLATIKQSTLHNSAYEAAVLEVVQHWSFRPKLTAECVPVESQSNVRVWFDVRDGKGVVSVSGESMGTTQGAQQTSRQRMQENWNAIRQSVHYPVYARKNQAEADLYAIALVDPSEGRALDVNVTWFKGNAASQGASKQSFINEVQRAVTNASFTRAEQAPYKVCLPFSFKLASR